MVVLNACYLKLFLSGQIRKQRETRDLKSFSHTLKRSVQFQFGNFIEHDKKNKTRHAVVLAAQKHMSVCSSTASQA